MNEESKLLEKLPLKQNVNNVRRIVGLIHSMDNSFWAWNVLGVLLNVGLTYGGMLLSAYVVNGISAGVGFSEMIRVVILASVGISLGWAVGKAVKRQHSLKGKIIFEKYSAMQQEKLMDLDFSLIDSPRLKEMRERIQTERNRGAGIYSLFWSVKNLFSAFVELAVAIGIGIPMFAYFGREDFARTAVAFVLLGVCLVIGVKVLRHFKNRTYYIMFHKATLEEKKAFWNYSWDFAMGSGHYRYQNGKDARIYNSYSVMKHWSYDKMQTKEFKDYYIRKPAIGLAGTGGTIAAMTVTARMVAYLVVIMAALHGEMPLGSVILYAGCLANIFRQIADFTFMCQDVFLDAKKQVGVLELLEISDEMYKGSLPLEKRSDNEYHIEFRNVSFKYPGSEQYALKNFSMELRVGEKLAIVGRNGSGKTTMIKLLCRLYDPEEGEILINGVDIKKFRHDEYSKLFSVVFQDYTLFSLMLAENIAVGKEYDGEKVKRCLADVGFGERLAELGEKGIRTYLYKDYTDEGVEISGGEAQKLAIARAIYKEAPFVLLDEPTAALDPIAESEIYENFDKIAGDKTAVYISHRLSSCRFCQKIAVFDKGELVQMGSHEELLAEKDGIYAALWNAQAKYYEQA